MVHSSWGDREPVEVLAEEFLNRRRRGETPSLAEYIARYPDLAQDIRELFPALVLMDDLDPRSAELSPPKGEAAPPLQQVGDYRILREIGRGGMGVVYEAVQVSLGRHVALKTLSAQALGNGQGQERFRREARAAANLHHTNIVPVFEVGNAGDVCYYAMQLITGQSLHQVIDELRRLRKLPSTGELFSAGPEDSPASNVSRASVTLLTGSFEPMAGSTSGAAAPAVTSATSSSPVTSAFSNVHTRHRPYYQSVARVGQQAAQALAYAHGRGIVHRDIKPANLLLDDSGVVWVTDFGLAKSEDDQLTRTGELPGTLRYMAPERFRGECDGRADVYALGLTLYELLLLQPAFPASDRLHLLENIRNHVPTRPRAIDKWIPRDLETVVLTAIEKDPRQRYASAAALAEDLRRFLADEPIRARRTRWPEWTWRWCRRNPVVASLSGALFLLLLLTAIGGVGMSLRLNDALGQANADRDKARDATHEGMKKLYVARVANAKVSRFSGRVGQRFDTLEEVKKAADLAHELRMPPEAFDELRNIAAAALALPDFREAAKTWDGWPAGSFSLAFDPVALRLYARGDLQGNVTVRRLEDDEEVARLSGPGRPRTILFGADGRTLLLYDSRNGALERWTIGGPAPEPVATITSDVCLWQQSRDGGRLLALHRSAEGTRAEVLDLPSGHPCFVHQSPTHDDWRTSLRAALSPDGRWLALADGAHGSPRRNKLFVYNLDTAKLVEELPNAGNVIAPVWHPDSRTLAVGNWNTGEIYVWDVASKKCRTLYDKKGGEPLVAMSPSGQLLMSKSQWFGGQFFWHPHSGKPLLRTSFDYFPTGTVQDGRLYEAAIDQTRVTLRIVEPSRVSRTLVPDPGGQETNSCGNVSVHPRGRLLAVGHWEGVSLFDLPTGLEVGRLDLGPNLFVHFDPSNGDLLTYGERGLFRWPVRITPGSPYAVVVAMPRLLGPGSHGTDAEFDMSQDGKVIVVADYTHAVVYRQDGDRLRAIVLGSRPDTRVARISPDGRWALTVMHATNEGVIWDTMTGRRVARFQVGRYGFFTPDGRWLTDGGGRLEVGPWKQGPPWPVVEVPTSLGFSPDGALFAGVSTGEVIPLVDTTSGKTLVHLALPEQSRSWFATFSPDGTQFIHQSVDQHCVYAWDLRALRGHLAKLDLDWKAPPFPPAPQEDRHLPPVVTVEPVNPSSRPEVGVELADPSVWLVRGREHVKLKQWDKLAADYVQALALLADANPDTESLRNRICAALAWREEAFAKAIELRPNDGGLWLARGRHYARQGQWEKAADAYGRAFGRAFGLQVVNDYEGLLVFVEHGAVQVLAGDTKGYSATCAFLCERFGHPEDPVLAHLVARPFVLSQLSEANAERVLKLAEQALAGKLPGKDHQAAALHIQGLAYYRAGRFEESVQSLNLSLRTDSLWTTNLNWPALALAHQRLGHDKEARSWLEKTDNWSETLGREIDKQDAGFPGTVNPADWLELQVLRREATEAIRGGPLKMEKENHPGVR